MEVQLRSHDGEIRRVRSVAEAFEAAEQDPEIWKISWSEDITQDESRRIRLVRLDCGGRPHWLYDPMQRYLDRYVFDHIKQGGRASRTPPGTSLQQSEQPPTADPHASPPGN